MFGKSIMKIKAAVERRGFMRLRPKGDAFVRIDGQDYPLHNWTPSGFYIRPYSGSLIAGQKATVAIVIRDLHDKDGEIRFNGRATVLRIGQDGLSARWWLLDPDQRQSLIGYYEKKRPAPKTE